MQVQVKQLPKAEVELKIQIPDEIWKKYEDEASVSISERIDVPGFRRGQAPKAFIIAQIGNEAFFQEVLNLALPKAYSEAIKSQKIEVISRPAIKVLSRSPFEFEARVAVFPEIKLKGIEKIRIPKEHISITEAEIEEVIHEMRKFRANFKAVDREIKKGDRIEIDFQGFDDGGAALDKTKSTNHPLFLGERSLVPGFEEELSGMKVGDKKKFPLKFPKDYHHEPFRGKTIHFQVELKRAEETILPELDEAFVEQVIGEKKSVSDFQKAIEGDLNRRREVENRRTQENKLLEKLMNEAKFDLPPVLVDEEIDVMIEDFVRELEGRGLKFETYLEHLRKEKRNIRKEYEAEAEKRLRIRLILNYLFRTLQIQVSSEEIELAGQKLLQASAEPDRKKLEESFAEKGEIYLRLKNNIMLEKLFSRFLDAA